MNIIEIYKKYHLPENLQLHMLRVAACSNLIIDNWNGEEIETESIIRVSLLHDIGNMVKIPEDFSNDEEFIKIRKEYFDKYGTNDHEINLEIGKREGLIEKEIDILDGKRSRKNEELKEIKYYKYPTYVDDEIKILMVEDISIEERKRIKANLFVGDVEDKLEIVKRIEKAINWLKNIDNGFTNTKVNIKQGHMEADSVYLYVYHNDIRDGFGLNRDNKNCICFVDYNIDGNTTLKNGGMFESNWIKFYHERINNMEIAWVELKYITKQKKFGRNETCWCGSGLKYKNCHGK